MADLYHYSYLNANGYLKKFQVALGMPNLDRAQLSKYLNMWAARQRMAGFIVKDDNGYKALYNKNVLNRILGVDETGFQVIKPQSNPYLNFLNRIIDDEQQREIEKEFPQEYEPEDYTPEDSDMQKVSDKLIQFDNYGEVMESVDKTVSSGSYIFCNSDEGLCILCGKRGNTAPSEPNKYNVPVGMKDSPMEDSVDCAVRETYEETGLNLPKNLFKHIGYDEWAPGKIGNNFLVKLSGDINDYVIGEGDGENDKFIWLPISKINNIPWAYGMDKTILNIIKNNNLMESKKKTIIITESQLEYINSHLTEGIGYVKYSVEPNKVKIVKKYLDDNFVKGGIACMGEDGYPTTTPIVALKGTDGQVARNMSDKQLFNLLLDKFGKIYSNSSRVKRFLQQIIKDWYYDKISKEGLLSKNLY